MLQRIIFLGLCILLFCQTQLLAQSFSVNPNIVRAFAENTISVKIEDWDCENIQVRTDNGKMKKVGPCRYTLIPQRLGATNITVSKVQNGVVIDLGIKTIMADGKSQAVHMPDVSNTSGKGSKASQAKENLPQFHVSFNGKIAGDLRRKINFKNKHLDLLCDDPQKLKTANIVSFRFVIIDGDIMEFEKYIDGDKLDSESILKLMKTKDNCRLLFTGIRVRFNGKMILIKDIEFVIKS